jgi:hypothetical protein
MNTRRVLQRLARRAGFSEVELVMFEGEPSYLMFKSIAFLAGRGIREGRQFNLDVRMP